MNIDTTYVQNQAKILAEYEVQRELKQAQRNESKYKAQLAAVSTLDTALKALGSAVKGLKGTDKSMLINAAAFSKEGMASATLGPSAKEGSYQFFVQQLASRHQVALSGLGDDAASSGNFYIKQDGVEFAIDLSTGDSNGDGKLSQEELSAAINAHPDNKGVKATLVRSGGEVTLVLTAENSGEKNRIELRTDANGSTLETSLGSQQELAKGQDAIVYLGADASGMKLQQSSNTFKDMIDGVSLTFNKVHQSGDEPLTVNISRDQSATNAKLNEFISAINALFGTFDTLTAAGVEGDKRGPLAGDSGTCHGCMTTACTVWWMSVCRCRWPVLMKSRIC